MRVPLGVLKGGSLRVSSSPDNESRRFFIIGGICGVVSVLLYLAAISLALPESPSQSQVSLAFLLGTGWPIIGVVFSYALYRLIALEQQGLANRLAFLFSLFGLATVTAMVSVQLAVQFGVREYEQLLDAPSELGWDAILGALRLVDLGLDLAWDLFMGCSMMIAAFPMYLHSRLGPLWAVPSFVLGLLLVGLNAATFPGPPASRGLFDIGPGVGLYMLLLSLRMLVFGRARSSSEVGRDTVASPK